MLQKCGHHVPEPIRTHIIYGGSASTRSIGRSARSGTAPDMTVDSTNGGPAKPMVSIFAGDLQRRCALFSTNRTDRAPGSA